MNCTAVIQNVRAHPPTNVLPALGQGRSLLLAARGFRARHSCVLRPASPGMRGALQGLGGAWSVPTGCLIRA